MRQLHVQSRIKTTNKQLLITQRALQSMRRLSLLLESIDTGSSILYIRDGEPIYYFGSHEMWNIIGGPQKLTNFILIFYYCDRKSRAACAQSFALWQQATIEIMLAISLLLARATYIMVLLFTHILFVVNHTTNATPPERLQHNHSIIACCASYM